MNEPVVAFDSIHHIEEILIFMGKVFPNCEYEMPLFISTMYTDDCNLGELVFKPTLLLYMYSVTEALVTASSWPRGC